MGFVFRYYICQKCNNRQRVQDRHKPKPCPKCGSEDLIVRPNWFIRFAAVGRWIERKVGPKEIALTVLRVSEAEVAQGKFRLTKERKLLVRDFALGDYWNLYAKSLKSSKDYWNRIHQHILPEWGELYLHNVTRRDILTWLERLKRKNKPATVVKNLNFVKGFFSQAVALRLLDENPVKGIKLKAVDNRRRDYLSVEDYHRLLDSTENEMLRTAIIIAIGTGMRAGELFAMKWSWCDYKRREITVPAEAAKSSQSRTIPMIEPVYKALQDVPHRSLASPYVLTSPRLGRPYADYMKGALKKAIERAGLPEYYSWHIIGRHTYASWFVSAGGDIYVLQKILGHESIKTTERYAHLAPKHKQKEAEKISHFFEANGDIVGIFQNNKE